MASEYGVSDLPGNGYRYVRDAQGIDTVIVNGEVAYTAARGCTDARAGDVVTADHTGRDESEADASPLREGRVSHRTAW